jgi:hypothetical protein
MKRILLPLRYTLGSLVICPLREVLKTSDRDMFTGRFGIEFALLGGFLGLTSHVTFIPSASWRSLIGTPTLPGKSVKQASKRVRFGSEPTDKLRVVVPGSGEKTLRTYS